MTEPTWECPTCGKVTWPFLHSCSGAWQPHPFVIATTERVPEEDR